MSFLALRALACCGFLVVLVPALALQTPSGISHGLYGITISTMGGAILFAGGIAFALAMENTLLRAGGNAAFIALYVAAAGTCAVGTAYCMSGVYPVNTSVAVLAFSVLLILAGLLWWRFYGVATG